MIAAMKDIQSTYGGGNITEPQLEDVFRNWLPSRARRATRGSTQFFPQWLTRRSRAAAPTR